jgi:hypothetical protein
MFRKVMPRRRLAYAGRGKWSVFAVAILGVASIATATPAQAITFDFTSCHVSALSGIGVDCGTQTNFGSVMLQQSGANVDVSVSLAGGNRFVQTAAADQQLFKFNGAAGAANITNTTTLFPPNAVAGGLQGAAGAFNGDDTGNFGFGVACAISANCNGSSTPIFNGLAFTVTNATIAQLTTPNNLGNIFVADVLLASNGLTGAVDVTGVTGVIPEATTLLMVGTALVGLGGAWRRRRLQKARLGQRAVSVG